MLTHDSGRHPAHQTGATAGRRPDRRELARQRPGLCSSIASTGAAGSTTSAHTATATACAPRLIRQTGRPPAAGAVASRGDRSASRAAWPAARVTLSGPDVLVELRHLYSNLLPARRRSLSCAIELMRGSARLTTPPSGKSSTGSASARIEELIAAYRRGPTAAALAVKIPDPSLNRRRVTPAAKK